MSILQKQDLLQLVVPIPGGFHNLSRERQKHFEEEVERMIARMLLVEMMEQAPETEVPLEEQMRMIEQARQEVWEQCNKNEAGC